MPHKDPETNRAYKRQWFEANRADVLARQNEWRRQDRAKHPEKYRAAGLAWRSRNRAKHCARQKAFRAMHPESVLASQRRWIETHRERTRERSRTYYANNLEAGRKARRAYNAAHPEVGRAAKQRKRAHKRHAPVNDLTHAQWAEIQEAQEHHCWYCGKRCKGKLTQDHIIPFSKGGSHTLHNVIGACRTCNSKKHTGPPLTPVQPLLLTVAPAKKRRVS